MTGNDVTPGTIGAVVIDHGVGGTPGLAIRAAADQAAGTGADKVTSGTEVQAGSGGATAGSTPALGTGSTADVIAAGSEPGPGTGTGGVKQAVSRDPRPAPQS